MDTDHYGLVKVKERILEHLAVQKRVPNGKAPILCFVGPPVWKNLFRTQHRRRHRSRFWANIFGRRADEAEIRGHRRTYVGSMPAKSLTP